MNTIMHATSVHVISVVAKTIYTVLATTVIIRPIHDVATAPTPHSKPDNLTLIASSSNSADLSLL